MRTNSLLIGLVAITALAGCASRPINEPITQFDPKSGYRPYLLIPKRQNNDPSTLFILSFSGGGTRAAAFSYGVLEELRRTEIVIDGKRRRLIDEVDVITGVSGGVLRPSRTHSTASASSPSTRHGSSSATWKVRCSGAP
jgi:NTE family protein